MAAFTAVAAGVGLAVTAVTTAVSFAQMAEENEKKKKAESAAAAAMMAARQKLDVNYYEQLGIQKEPYELARREMLVQGAMATDALREGDPRALAAGVGRVQLAQQGGQEKVAIGMQQEQSQLEKLVAGEDSRLRDLKTQLDLQEVVGAQQAMSDAARAEQMALQQGLAGVTSMAGQVSSMAPLYEKSASTKAVNRANERIGNEIPGRTLKDELSIMSPDSLPVKPSKPISAMNTNELNAYYSQLSPSFINQIKSGQPTNIVYDDFGPDLKPLQGQSSFTFGNTAYDATNPFGIITYDK
jgi:hypothetical protein